MVECMLTGSNVKDMNRSIDSAFTTDIVRYSIGCDLQPILDFADGTEYNIGSLKQTIHNRLHILPLFKRLFSHIQECLDDYKDLYQYDCYRIEPVLSWINVSTAKEEHHEHNHPNSLISGILYLKSCTPTYFSSPASAARTGVVVFNNHPMTYESQGIAGDLILFPSYLDHYTVPGGERCTLSFNTMPKGLVNQGTLMEMDYR